MTLALSDVSDLINRTLERQLPGGALRLQVSAVTTEEFQEALRVTVVLPPRLAGAEQAGVLAATSADVQWELSRAGDSRFAYIEYTTEAELTDLDG